ncbi:hypothetical protein, partial [Frankia sp. Cr1]|uniref:hypothetical protein n=1 Tax=Frankia sp. Cr1 TaxID=3073931 RepID=UPI002AD4C0FF
MVSIDSVRRTLRGGPGSAAVTAAPGSAPGAAAGGFLAAHRPTTVETISFVSAMNAANSART